MWIWYVSTVQRRRACASIISTARRYGVGTLMIKAATARSAWSQFSPELVSALHAGGLQVCAWQYVYGTHPIAEAKVGAAAVHDGADCLLIDAESRVRGQVRRRRRSTSESCAS